MKRQKLIGFVSCIVLICLCGACVGVSVTGDKCASVKNPNISKNKGYIGYTPLANGIYVTETELLKYWEIPMK